MAIATPSSARAEATLASWYGLVVLTVVTLFATVDRQVFVLLAVPISKELGLSNFQLGLLQGLGVVIFSVVATYPIAWLADRYDRRIVMSGCIVLWSLSVVCCGLATGFNQLFLASTLVGAGAAGLSPIVYSLIPEMFLGSRRQMANSIYTVASIVGSGLAIALCGYLIALADSMQPYFTALPSWRLTLFLAAVPAPVFIALMLGIRLPPRLGRPAATTVPVGQHPTVAEHRIGLAGFVRQNLAAFASFSVGVGSATFAFSAVAVWMPVVAIRQFGATQTVVGNQLGAATFVAAAVGWLITAYGVRALRPLLGDRMPILVIAGSAMAGAIGLAAIGLATSSAMLFVIYAIFYTCVMAGNMIYPTALQDMTPDYLRARIVALTGVVVFLFIAAGPPVVGIISDQFKTRADGLLLTTVGCGAVALALCALLMLVSSRYFVATVRNARLAEETGA